LRLATCWPTMQRSGSPLKWSPPPAGEANEPWIHRRARSLERALGVLGRALHRAGDLGSERLGASPRRRPRLPPPLLDLFVQRVRLVEFEMVEATCVGATTCLQRATCRGRAARVSERAARLTGEGTDRASTRRRMNDGGETRSDACSHERSPHRARAPREAPLRRDHAQLRALRRTLQVSSMTRCPARGQAMSRR
jgi:hypothetical protein